jgi:hypothetical protein
MTDRRLTTTVLPMTMNWYVMEHLIADRNRELVEADGRRWPEVRHARTVASARRARPIRELTSDLAGTGLVPRRAVARR